MPTLVPPQTVAEFEALRLLLLNPADLGPDYIDDGYPRGHSSHPEWESAWSTTQSSAGPSVSQLLVRYSTPQQAPAARDAAAEGLLSYSELEPLELPVDRPPGARLVRTVLRSKTENREFIVFDAMAVKGSYLVQVEPFGDRGTGREPAPELALRVLQQLVDRVPGG